MATTSARAILRIRDFRFFVSIRAFSAIGITMQSVAVGWQVYDITRDPLSLGYVGLSLFVPFACLTLIAGEVADRIDRRLVMACSFAVQALTAALFLGISVTGAHEAELYYLGMAIFGVGRAFTGPALFSLAPLLVSSQQLPQAVAWGSSVNQTATILGPALGGALFVLGPEIAYGTSLALLLLNVVMASSIRTSGSYKKTGQEIHVSPIRRLLAGLAYVRTTPLLLGAITLDLFAVLLGGATALLPIYARDILDVGPEGLGLLRSAPSVGAATMGLLLANFPPQRRAGVQLFSGVALFGVATIVFGVSHNFIVSLIALAALGAGDIMSVFVRATIVQLATPELMRGRVSAVHSLFVGASNELGEFESGVTAAWFGTIPAVVLGGVGTLIVVGLWTRLFPDLRCIDRLADLKPPAATAGAANGLASQSAVL
jgi:MFS family permease